MKKINLKNEQPWTLAYILVLQTTSSPLSFFLVPIQNDAM
jgi:hypothetical protein